MSSANGAFTASTQSFTNSRRVFKELKDYSRGLVDQEIFVKGLHDWVLENYCENPGIGEASFRSPFLIEEICKLDLALEGVLFQQLCRMPCTPPDFEDKVADEFLALEDFLHTVVNGLWRTFWHKSGPVPFFLTSFTNPGSKLYALEKAISRGKLQELSGLALISRSRDDVKVRWDQVVEVALFRPDLLSGDELRLSPIVICEAIFCCFHMLISRNLSKHGSVGDDSVLVLLLDSKFGAVVELGGDLSKLEFNSTNPYCSAVEWVKYHAKISVSALNRIWNKLGNVNWTDQGALQVLLATYYSIHNWKGPPRKSIDRLATAHSLRVQKRRIECCQAEYENAQVASQQGNHEDCEILDLGQHDNPSTRENVPHLTLKQGEILLLEDQQQGQKQFQIQESFIGGNYFLYGAISLDYPAELYTLYVGAHPTRLEPSWEDMNLWYQVQRQTKVLNILKQQGILSKYLPGMIASGQIVHSGACKKRSPRERCDHPWCGTPILVTTPLGEPLSHIVARYGSLSADDALRSCRDSLAALRSAAAANVQHGDICPENIMRTPNVHNSRNESVYILVSWGRAVLEDRDRPAINLQFSSSHALQHGKLCPSSDVESLVYLLYFACGGGIEQQDSIESALQWKERSWANRSIQQQLGVVSLLLKAFADYVDSLCGTPYPVDYDIWVTRLSKAVEALGDRGKMIEEIAVSLRLEDVAESSGTSGVGV